MPRHGNYNLAFDSRLIKPSLTVGLVPRPITLALVVLALACTLFMSGCGKGAGGSGLHVKSPATSEKDMPVKSSYAFAVTKTFTDTAGKMTTAATYNVYTANYDLDSANFAQTMNKPMASDDQMRVVFSLVNDEGGTEKSPAKAAPKSRQRRPAPIQPK